MNFKAKRMNSNSNFSKKQELWEIPGDNVFVLTILHLLFILNQYIFFYLDDHG